MSLFSTAQPQKSQEQAAQEVTGSAAIALGIATATALFMIVIMVGFSHSSLNTRATGISKMLGDLAYPIFLLHWQVGFLVSQFVFDGKARGFDILAVSIPFILILAFGVNWLAARFIEPIRGKIRPGRAVSENAG